MNFRFWQHRWIRRLTWTFLALALALVVEVVLESVFLAGWISTRASRNWQDVQAMLKAEGETLDFRVLASDPIPDEENFCAIPLLKDLALSVDCDNRKGIPGKNRARLSALKLAPKAKGKHFPASSSSLLGRRMDLKAWAEALRDPGKSSTVSEPGDAAHEVLAALSKHDATVRELAAGLVRRRAQWTPGDKTRQLPKAIYFLRLPHSNPISDARGMLRLRCIADAQAGEIGEAHEAAQIMARFIEASLDQPYVVPHLLGATGAEALATSTWELCDAHAGSAEDFAELEAALAQLDFRRSALRTFRGDLMVIVNLLQAMKDARGDRAALAALTSGDIEEAKAFEHFPMRWWPAAFFDIGSTYLADREFRFVIKPLRDEGWRKAIQSAAELEDDIRAAGYKMWRYPDSTAAELLLPSNRYILCRSAITQAMVNQAVIACALERFRIEKGSYPELLDEVKLASGGPLPMDEMNGKPMGYRKTANGRYALWSVGFDGKDDGGKRVVDERKSAMVNLERLRDPGYKGDWVWDFPTDTKAVGEKHE